MASKGGAFDVSVSVSEQWKNPGWGCLGYVGDEILPGYVGIIFINHF